MHDMFSTVSGMAWEFVQVSAYFLLTMLLFFSVKQKRYLWLNYLMLVTFVLQWLFLIVVRDGLPLKLFATLMLMTVLIVETVVSRRRRA
ncbi:MAG TPA: hypothetical protein VF546_08795 [Pyrinomonadaceae bacterium]|jgi:hypothetical protein